MASLRIKDSKMSIMELGIIVTVDGEVITEDGEILEDSNPLHLSHLNKEVGDNKAEEIQADGDSKVEETPVAGDSKVVETHQPVGDNKVEETDSKAGASKAGASKAVKVETIAVGESKEDGDIIALKFINKSQIK
jgi:hypothetical protein